MGTVQGDLEFEKIQASASYRQFIALMAKDKIVSLAEAIGALACENPEQGVWGESLHIDIDLLVGQVERVLGFDISPPPIDGGLLKIRSEKGLFHERDVNAIFTAWSMGRILQPPEGTSICEIGAGTGRVAYWSQRLGFTSYTVVDIPLTNVIQGFYLLKALPEASITLYGEASKNQPGAPAIRILPFFCIDEVPPNQFDLVLNQDSFPEINRETVVKYLEWIKIVSRQFFYSINHESRPRDGAGNFQLNVQALIAEAGGYRRVSRVPYWLRRGYVSELYEVAEKERSRRAG